MQVHPDAKVCDTDKCPMPACAKWSARGDTNTIWNTCEDCQTSDFGGWPVGYQDANRPAVPPPPQHKVAACPYESADAAMPPMASFQPSAQAIAADSDSESEDEYDNANESDFDFDDDDGLFDFDAAEDDFGNESTLAQIADAFRKTPPLTKAFLVAATGALLWGKCAHKNNFPTMLQLDWAPTLRGQLRRPFTAFVNFGPLGLGNLMTLQFVWTDMSALERLNHDAPYDFWLMILFGAGSMVAGCTAMSLRSRICAMPRPQNSNSTATFLMYTWSSRTRCCATTSRRSRRHAHWLLSTNSNRG